MSHSRRDFLKSVVGTSTLVSLSPAMPTFMQQSALAAGASEPSSDTVLVVVQLSGGNDGLNTVVPYSNDIYARSRSTLRLTASDVHPIDSDLGFHPEMPLFSRLFKDGQMMVVQGVGYPNSNRGHDEALRDWHTARPGQAACQTGWLGRAIDHAERPDEPSVPATLVAPIPMPLALGTQRAVVPSVRSAEKWTLRTDESQRKGLLEAAKQSATDSDNPLAHYVQQSSLAAHATSHQVAEVLRTTDRQDEYPSFSLAKQFKTISELIRADLGVRIFFAELGGGGIGGFDNHANQRDNHAALLRELSISVAAFVDDLNRAKLLDRVLLMSFSEFGRTLSENGRRGTGHGAAAPVFLAGGRLKGGLFGEHPDLADLKEDAPRHHTDYRQVYATALERWLGFPSEPVLGASYKALDLFV
ncbi:hypothetical protein CA13_15790 [Planctomycetes bacterium CA13]|uniref:DUF1501 domain-containing protein n=1 Tax=Novipirellula herctigrandis TaxID=2527986 RepID=A0A5C5YZJ3_9BACT|nr:hypothetical protein CA13_15790 [Planctomycetes bacterium CA13]